MRKRAGPQDLVSTDNYLFYWLTKAMNHRNTALAQALAPLKCTVAQWRVMNMLRQQPCMSMGELADKTAVDRTTLTRTLDSLEANALVSRCPRADNRRVVELNLTRRGHNFYDRILPVVREENERAMQGVSDEQTAAAIAVLQTLSTNLCGVASSPGDRP